MGSSTDSRRDAGTDDLAKAGLEHLQAAAREAIQAARVLLDVAERVVDDPAAVQAAVGSLSAVARAALQQLRVPDAPSTTADAADTSSGGGERIQRIRVS